MYLPKHQYTIKSIQELKNVSLLTDSQGNLVSIPGKNIILTSTGELFDRRTVDVERGNFTDAVKLFPTTSPEETESENSPGYEFEVDGFPVRTSLGKILPAKLPPTDKEKQAGVMTRCFYKNTSTGKVKEITQTQANSVIAEGERFEKVLCVDWQIKGPAKDQTINGYFLEGIETQNQRTIDLLKQSLPGTEALIQSPGEYVEDITPQFIQPVKPENTKITLPAPSK